MLLAQCGSDKATSSELAIGDTTDAGFSAVRSVVSGNTLNYNEEIISISMDLADLISSEPAKRAVHAGAPADIDSIYITQYLYSNYWHIFYCSAYVGVDSLDIYFSVMGVDSIRFGDDNGYEFLPETGEVTTMNARAHFDFEMQLGLSYAIIDKNGHFDAVGVMEKYFTISAGYDDNFTMHLKANDTSYCDLNFAIEATARDLYFDSAAIADETCPESGSASATATVAVSCLGNGMVVDSLDIAGGWTANFVFHNNYVTATYSDGTTRWEVTEECGGENLGSPGWIEPAKRLKK
jgi:hypothetical protein